MCIRRFVKNILLLLPAGVLAQEKVIPAINEVDPWQQVGQQPYEFTWTQREQDPHTLVDFEDMQGWTLELYHGAQGELRRSREQQMWGEYVAKIVYSGARPESRMIARPPQPIPIPGRFDSMDLWGYGNRWEWVPDPTTPPADVAVLIQDARGKEFRVQLTAALSGPVPTLGSWPRRRLGAPPSALSPRLAPSGSMSARYAWQTCLSSQQ